MKIRIETDEGLLIDFEGDNKDLDALVQPIIPVIAELIMQRSVEPPEPPTESPQPQPPDWVADELKPGELDPVAVIPLDDNPPAQVRNWVCIHERIGGLQASLRDAIFYGFGNSEPEALEALAAQLETVAARIRERIKE